MNSSGLRMIRQLRASDDASAAGGVAELVELAAMRAAVRGVSPVLARICRYEQHFHAAIIHGLGVDSLPLLQGEGCGRQVSADGSLSSMPIQPALRAHPARHSESAFLSSTSFRPTRRYSIRSIRSAVIGPRSAPPTPSGTTRTFL